MEVKVDVVKVSGICNAALQESDFFLLDGAGILLQGHNRTCSLLCSSIVLNAGRLRLLKSPLFVSCPDPGTGDGGNVIVRLSAIEP